MTDEIKKSGELKALSIMHKALLMGQVLFLSIAFLLVYNNLFSSEMQEIDKILQVISVVIGFGGFYAGSIVFKKRIEDIKTGSKNLTEKLNIYRAACIVQWALIEGPALFTIICFLLTGNYAFMILAVVLMILFVALAPSKIKMIFHLQLSQQESEEL